MKKSKISLVSMMLLSALASCGGSAELKHIHRYDDFLSFDEQYHEKICPTCEDGEEGHSIKEAHHFDNGFVSEQPTHTTNGIKTFTCLDCGYSYTETIAHTTGHKYDRMMTSSEYLASPATCTEKAKYFYSCECGAIGNETFEMGDTAPHTLTALSIQSDSSKKNYDAYQKYDPTGLVLTYTCSVCGQSVVDPADVVYVYPSGKASLSSSDTKVTAWYEGMSVDINGINVARAVNNFENLEDIEITCHEEISLANVTSKFGDVEFTIQDKTGKVIAPSDYNKLEEYGSPYALTASVAEGEEYDAISQTKTITVTHKVEYKQNKLSDCCSCGLSKIKDYYYDASTESVDETIVSGLLKDQFFTHGDITYESGAALNWTSVGVGQEIGLKTTINGEEIHFVGMKADKVLTTLDELAENLTAENNMTSKGKVLGDGYYVVGCDIDGQEAEYNHGFFQWGPTSGQPQDESTYYYSGNAFKGTLDGRGHTISNFKLGGFGIISYLSWDGKVMNLSLKDVTPLSSSQTCCLVNYSYHASYSDVTIEVKSFPSKNGSKLFTSGTLVAYRTESTTLINNVTINCPGCDIGYIFGQVAYGGESLTTNNFVVNCKSYNGIGNGLNALPKGTTVNTNK